MTQHHADDENTATPALTTDEEILQRWYYYASQQPESIGSLLRILRSLQKKSEEQQQIEFEVSAADFAELQSLPIPREHCFRYDAQRIAAACHVGRTFNFIQALLLARHLVAPIQESEGYEAYEAAFDTIDLDKEATEEE